MTKFIAIPPTNYMYLLLGNGGYVLSLAHLYTDPAYQTWHKFYSSKGYFMIMDNSAYELGGSVDMQMLWDLIQKYPTSELVMPDVLKDRSETFQRTKEALLFLTHKRDLDKSLESVMVVPQGKNVDEWTDSFLEIYHLLEFLKWPLKATIGIPKHSANFDGGRHLLLANLDRYLQKAPLSVDIHLLGVSEPNAQLKAMLSLWGKRVRTVDSAKPCVQAIYGQKLKPNKVFDHVNRPTNYFGWEMDDTLFKLMRHNIKYMVREVTNASGS